MCRQNPWCSQDLWSSDNASKHTLFCKHHNCNSIYPIGWALGVSVCQPIIELRKIVAYQEKQNENNVRFLLINNGLVTEQIMNYNETIRSIVMRGRLYIHIK